MKTNKDFCNFLNILFSHVHCILSHVLWFTHQLQTTLTSLKYKQIEWPFGCPKCFLQELNSVSMECQVFWLNDMATTLMENKDIIMTARVGIGS